MEKAKILLIDDKPANLLALEVLLGHYPKEDGYSIEVLKAQSGKEGLKILLEMDVDLILLDVQMPEMDGYETARLIASSQRTHNIPIIFLSAIYNDEFHINQAYQGGAIDFISKPINPNLLKAKVSNFLKYQRAVRARTEAEKEKEAVVRTNAMKSQFLTNMNHELRTPMTGVLGMASLMLVSENLNSNQRECLEVIKRSGDQMLSIVDDILDIASLEAQQLSLVPETFQFHTLIDEVIDLYRYKIEEKKIELKVNISPALNNKLVGDARRTKQAIRNLLSNAIKFTKEGEITLKLSEKENSNNTITVEIEIRDTGIGIDEETKNSLFQLFAQGDGSMTKRYAGTGLGLIITKRLVELMGGSIHWSTELGKGSTFALKIPFQKAPTTALTVATPAAVANLPQAAQSGRDTILVVDDALINLKVAERMIKFLGYKCDKANNGREAVEAVEKKADYFVILMDCLMPEMDGLEATRIIRKIEKRHTPIIAVTANTITVDREMCFDAGMDSYIAKPLEPKVLEEELTRWLKSE